MVPEHAVLTEYVHLPPTKFIPRGGRQDRAELDAQAGSGNPEHDSAISVEQAHWIRPSHATEKPVSNVSGCLVCGLSRKHRGDAMCPRLRVFRSALASYQQRLEDMAFDESFRQLDAADVERQLGSNLDSAFSDPRYVGGIDYQSFDFVEPAFYAQQKFMRYSSCDKRSILMREAALRMTSLNPSDVGVGGPGSGDPPPSPGRRAKPRQNNRTRYTMSEVDPQLEMYIDETDESEINRQARLIAFKTALEIKRSMAS